MGRATPVLAVCPINPFYWPVKPSLGKVDRAQRRPAPIRKANTADLFSPFRHGCGCGIRKIYFGDGAGVDATENRAGVSSADCHGDARSGRVRTPGGKVRRRAGILFGRITTCLKWSAFCGSAIVCFRRASTRSSRPCPRCVPSAGVTMDERIGNLMRDRGHEHL